MIFGIFIVFIIICIIIIFISVLIFGMNNFLNRNTIKSSIKVLHYEGIDIFNLNDSCQISIKNNLFEIKKYNTETILNISLEKIISINILDKKTFYIQYHKDINPNQEFKGYVNFLVLKYITKDGLLKNIVFWDSGSSNNITYFIKYYNNLKTEKQ